MNKDYTNAIRFTAPVGAIFAITVAYTTWSSLNSLPPYQWALAFALLIIALTALFFMEKGLLTARRAAGVTVIIYALVAFTAFHSTTGNIFRSDYWLIAELFNSFDQVTIDTLRRISLFEIMGDPRFQPLAHLLMYLRFLVFKFNPLAFHTLNIALHTLTAFLIYLIVKEFTAEKGLAFITGLIFIVLQSQFDTVVWTYHIYIITGGALLFAAILLARRYSVTGERAYFIYAVLFSLASLLLYEPAVAGPAAVAGIVLFNWRRDGQAAPRRTIYSTALIAIAAYIAYMLVTLFGTSLTTTSHKMGMGELTTLSNIGLAVKALFVNLWQSSFIINTGMTATLDLSDIVYIRMPEDIFTTINIIKLIPVVFLAASLRAVKGTRATAAIIATIALSYLFIISLGRMHSNSLEYFISQPRYQYFPNAALIILVAVLLSAKFKEKIKKPLISAALAAIFFWNLQNTLIANNKVSDGMEFLDSHYYRIKDFTANDPSRKLYMNFTPGEGLRFALGADIALDLMLGERLSSFPSKATHIYTEDDIMENPFRSGGGVEAAELGNFFVSWTYLPVYKLTPQDDVEVLGGKHGGARISITNTGEVNFRAVRADTGTTDTITLKNPYFASSYASPEGKKTLKHMAVVKDGNEICLYFNNRLADKKILHYPYKNWRVDGSELFGSHYSGSGGAAYVLRLFKQLDSSDYSCSSES